MKHHTYLIAPVALMFRSSQPCLPKQKQRHANTALRCCKTTRKHGCRSTNKNARLHKNVTHIRTEIHDVIGMNKQIGEANKTANKIHKTLSLIAPHRFLTKTSLTLFMTSPTGSSPKPSCTRLKMNWIRKFCRKLRRSKRAPLTRTLKPSR